MEDLIVKHCLILFNDKCVVSGSFTYIDLTLCSLSAFSWKIGPDPCGSNKCPIILENDGQPSLGKGSNGMNFSSMQHSSPPAAMIDVDDPKSLFASILLRTLQNKLFLRHRQYQNVSINYGFPTHVKMQSKSATWPSIGTNVNQARVT